MRGKRKRHLDSRLAQAGDYMISLESEDKNFATCANHTDYLNYAELFGNDNPVELEIGCGKGQFICTLAKQNPDINYLAVEKVGNVIIDGVKLAREENLSNVRFLKCGAEYLGCYLPPKSVGRIYLNFSCPFPKKSYASHRLTAPLFLNLYRSLLKDGAEIHQKTDNMHFFEFSIEQFTNNGYALKNISLDLHHSDFEGNIVTEYEKRFSDMGCPIYRLEAFLK